MSREIGMVLLIYFTWDTAYFVVAGTMMVFSPYG